MAKKAPQTQQDSFLQKVSEKFSQDLRIADRLNFAKKLAAQYKIEKAEVILCYTHPDLRNMPLTDRCKKFGITEEELLFVASQPEFKKFLRDWEDLTMTNLRSQSVSKLQRAVDETRIVTTKDGSTSESFDIEMSVLKEKPEAPPPVQVNIQNNMDSVWARARSAALPVATGDDE